MRPSMDSGTIHADSVCDDRSGGCLSGYIGVA